MRPFRRVFASSINAVRAFRQMVGRQLHVLIVGALTINAANGDNVPPTISPIADLAVPENWVAAASVTVNDVDSPIEGLSLTASSSNARLVPKDNVLFGGSGGTRTVVVVPALDEFGMTTITLFVSDGLATSSTTFQLTVNGTRLVRVRPATGMQGSDVVIPIGMSALGGENAVAFSLLYDPTLLGEPRGSSSISAAQLNMDTTQAGTGRVGIALALPTGEVLLPGTCEIAQITMTISSAASAGSTPASVGSIPVSFGDQPVLRSVTDVSGSRLSTVFADGSVTVIARDSDNDGMPDYWEVAQSLDPNDPSDATLDSDGDGLSNLGEFRAGTNPQDPVDTLAISAIETVGDDLRLGYKTLSGVYYRVDRSDVSPVGPWTSITAGMIGGNGTVQFASDTGGAIHTRFYRVVAQQVSP